MSQDTGASTTEAPTSDSLTTASSTSDAPTSDSDSTGERPGDSSNSATSAEDTTDGEADTSSTGEPAPTTTSTGGEPDWIAECALEGITVMPAVPAASDEWTVRFEHRLPLTNVTLSVAAGPANEMSYGVDSSCSVDPPFCWEFAPYVDSWPSGSITLSVSASEIDDAACDIELL